LANNRHGKFDGNSRQAKHDNTRNVSERDLISSPASDSLIAANYNIRHPLKILSYINNEWKLKRHEEP
jgi:hypothetical protein